MPTYSLTHLVGGILLGPTAFGRIPGFTEHVFPIPSRPYLSLVANIGLSLFLFLVGLEIDAGVIRRNARLSMTVAFAGMVIRESQVPRHQNVVIAIVISVLKMASLRSFWFGFRSVSTFVQPVRGQDGRVCALHAVCWSRVFHHRVSGIVPYPDGTQTPGHDRWNCCPVCRGWERHCRMDALSLECRLGKRRFGTHGCVDPLDLYRVDIILASSDEEGGSMGRRPDWFHQQWAIEELHDVRYPSDVRIRILYRCHRRPRDLRFVLIPV